MSGIRLVVLPSRRSWECIVKPDILVSGVTPWQSHRDPFLNREVLRQTRPESIKHGKQLREMVWRWYGGIGGGAY
jgi:hypothetical protein